MARTHGVIKPAFWTGKTGRGLRGQRDAQLLAIYLLTGPQTTMLGIYYLPLPHVQHDLGMTPGELDAAFAVLAADGFAEYDAESEIVWVPNLARDQVGKLLKSNDKRRPALMRQLVPHEGHRFYAAFVTKYREDYLLDVKPLPGEEDGPSEGLPPSGMPPYPDPVPDPVPESGDPLLDFAKAWRKRTHRSEFADYVDGCGQLTGTEQQWLVEVRKMCSGSAAEFDARVVARLAEDPKGFLLGQTLEHWRKGPLQRPASAPPDGGKTFAERKAEEVICEH